MPWDKFLIAPITQGQQTNVKPWLIMDDAFVNLRNVFTWRGRIRKRFGGRVMNGSKSSATQQQFTRLRINVATTAAVSGDLVATVMPGAVWKIGQIFSVGNTYFTVYQAAGATLTTGAATATFDTATGTLVITGNTENPSTAVFFYPAEPVMCLGTYDVSDSSDEVLIAFDTQFAYEFTYATGWNIAGPIPPAANSGLWDQASNQNADFHWVANYRGTNSYDFLMFVTNNRTLNVGTNANGIKYWDGTNWTTLSTAATMPINGNANPDYIDTCKLILPFKNRLCLFNTTEQIWNGAAYVARTFRNRVRFSQNGSPIATDAWREDISGKGDFLDAPVKESILSAEFLKDRLIVYFEASTWELVYTGNEILPFQWQQINTELGAESMNSIIPFDKAVLGFGNNGIHDCNGINVTRIDQMIPDTIFDVNNANSGIDRVAGIRDYWVQMVYWTYNANQEQTNFNQKYPNRVLVYDYIQGTWAYNDDSITAFGNYQYQQDLTWADIESQWLEMNEVWDDPSFNDRFKSVIAGNQEGFTFIVDNDRNNNCMSLSITNITYVANVVTFTCVDHNLTDDSFVYLSNITDSGVGANLGTIFNGNIFQVNTTTADEFEVILQVPTPNPVGTYTGGGTVQRVSALQITSKQYNFYNKIGQQVALQKIDFYVDNSRTGEISMAIGVSSADFDLVIDAQTNGTLLGNNVLTTSPYPTKPLETQQDRFWHTLYFNASGENFQLSLAFSEEQITDPDIAFADFQLNAFIFYVMPINQLGA